MPYALAERLFQKFSCDFLFHLKKTIQPKQAIREVSTNKVWVKSWLPRAVFNTM